MPISVSPTGPGGKKELSMEMRLLIAFVLVMALLLVAPFFTSSPGPKGPSNVTPKKAEEVTQPAPAAPVPPPAKVEAEAKDAEENPEEEISAKIEDIPPIETKLYSIKFSNKGGVVTSWILKQYQDLNGHPLQLVNPALLEKLPAPFSLDLKETKPKVDLNAAGFKYTRTPDGLGIDFEYAGGGLAAKKSFRFDASSYLVNFSSEVASAGKPIPHLVMWRGGFGDVTLQTAATVQRTLYFDNSQGRLQMKTARDAKDAPVSVSGPFSFAGIEDSFFAAVFIPVGTGTTELKTYSDQVPFGPEKKEEAFPGGGVGSGDGINKFALFLGPKDTDILRQVDIAAAKVVGHSVKLDDMIDWGRWFGFLAKPLFTVLNWTSDNLIHNFGWSIIFVTILINMLLMPLRLTSMRSAKKMQALQPQIQAINAKYKSLPLRDPKQAEKNTEMMALYKKYGVNPLGGCLPMLLQLPFFIAFYTALTVAIELRGAHWLWVSDLSRPEQLPIRLLPVILVVTQFLSQKMTPPSPGADPTQQKMMMIMPLVLGFMFYYASSGLVLYWLTGNLVGIVQQWFTNRTTPAPVIDVKPVSKKKSRN